MSSEKEHSQIVLSAILPDRKDLLDYAVLHLTPDHFESPYRTIFTMLDKYFQVSKGILTRQGVQDLLERSGVVDVGIIASYVEHYDTLETQEASEEDFRWGVDQLKELLARKKTEEAILEGAGILKHGVKGLKGVELKGHSDARASIIDKFALIEQSLEVSEAPEGDIRNEKDEILEEYRLLKERRESGASTGLLFGIPSLDDVVGGLQAGELDLVVGYSSSGKSSFCVQAAWHASMMQGKNIVFATTETLRPQIRRKLIARHSKMPQFNYPEGLNTKNLKRGTLSREEERILEEVVDDISSNSDYGKLEVIQIPRGSTISTLENRLNRYQREFHVDGCVMDYLALLRPSRKRNANWEEVSDTIKEAKNIAATFDNGRGIPILSPWQTTRAQKELADKVGYYTTSALAESHESTKSADLILSILEPAQTQRYTQLSGAVIKNRDGEQSGSIEISVDYATSYFTDASNSISTSGAASAIEGFLGLL